MSVLRTDRLVLRPFIPDDVAAMVALDSDAEVLRFTEAWDPVTPAHYRELVAEIITTPTWWAAEEAGEFVGWFYLQESELGYRLKRSAWGRGLATEGARAVLAVAEGTVVADAYEGNVASLRVLEKLGFHPVGSKEGDGGRLILFER